jgi:hydrogenase expression/formation protein HypC
VASLFLLQHEDLQVGDLVMIHVGNAIQKMTEDEARSAWDLYDEVLELEAT